MAMRRSISSTSPVQNGSEGDEHRGHPLYDICFTGAMQSMEEPWMTSFVVNVEHGTRFAMSPILGDMAKKCMNGGVLERGMTVDLNCVESLRSTDRH